MTILQVRICAREPPQKDPTYHYTVVQLGETSYVSCSAASDQDQLHRKLAEDFNRRQADKIVLTGKQRDLGRYDSPLSDEDLEELANSKLFDKYQVQVDSHLGIRDLLS